MTVINLEDRRKKKPEATTDIDLTLNLDTDGHFSGVSVVGVSNTPQNRRILADAFFQAGVMLFNSAHDIEPNADENLLFSAFIFQSSRRAQRWQADAFETPERREWLKRQLREMADDLDDTLAQGEPV